MTNEFKGGVKVVEKLKLSRAVPGGRAARELSPCPEILRRETE